MNREAWRRLMRMTMWTDGNRRGSGRVWGCKNRNASSFITPSCNGERFLCDWGRGRPVVVDWRHKEMQRNDVGRWRSEIFSMMLGSARHYAAPLSKVGKPAQSSKGKTIDPNAPPEPDKPERRINRAIVSRTVRLIIGDGHEILSRMEALKRAEHMDLDLVEVDGKQDPPVCKLMDFNKERFKGKQREKELKKKQSERRRLDDMKEVRFSTRTEQNDLQLKAQMAVRLLSKGHRVKLAVIPHGNDDLEPKGRELIEHMITLLQENSKVESSPKFEKQRAWVTVRPISAANQAIKKIKRESDNLDVSTKCVSESNAVEN